MNDKEMDLLVKKAKQLEKESKEALTKAEALIEKVEKLTKKYNNNNHSTMK